MKKKYEIPQIVVVAMITQKLLNSSYIPVTGGTVKPKAPSNNIYDDTESLDLDYYHEEEDD